MEEVKTLRIDIYADVDYEDIGKELSLDVGEIRDMETGVIYTGKIRISGLKPIGSNITNPFEDTNETA